MALIIEKEFKGTNLVGNYWIITEINRKTMEGIAGVRIDFYKDRQSFLNGANSIDHREYIWKGSEYPFNEEVLTQPGVNDILIAYHAIKSRDPYFAGYINVYDIKPQTLAFSQFAMPPEPTEAYIDAINFSVTVYLPPSAACFVADTDNPIRLYGETLNNANNFVKLVAFSGETINGGAEYIIPEHGKVLIIPMVDRTGFTIELQ